MCRQEYDKRRDRQRRVPSPINRQHPRQHKHSYDRVVYRGKCCIYRHGQDYRIRHSCAPDWQHQKDPAPMAASAGHDFSADKAPHGAPTAAPGPASAPVCVSDYQVRHACQNGKFMPGGSGSPPVMSFIRRAFSALAAACALRVARQIRSSRISALSGSMTL